MRRLLLIVGAVVAGLFAAGPSRAQSAADNYSIIKPEPWLAPKYQSPRSAQQAPPPSHVLPPKISRERVPPAIVVPETGRVLPNLPVLSPSGPNGTETGQDRAVRCADQLGTYGAQAGNPAAYLGSCVNQ
jgi:hypothetical protein